MSRRAPLFVLAVVVVAVVVGTFVLPSAEPVEPVFNRLNALAFAVVGVVACRRHEGRRIGWTCLLLAATAVLYDLTDGYAATGRTGAVWSYWVGQWASLPQPVLLLVVLPAWFPTGAPLSPRWRWIVPSATGFLTVAMLSAAIAVDAYELESGRFVRYLRNPAAVPALDVALEPAFLLSVLGALVCAVAALVSLVVRYRRARGVERLQLRWLLVGVATLIAMAVGLLGLGALGETGIWETTLTEDVLDGAFGVVQLVLPVSIGLAMTRYRLYDLDRIVSRTTTYAVVGAVLSATYALLVVSLGAVARAATGESGDLVVALSTLGVAGLARPVLARVHGSVDRRFHRARYDAARTIDAFGRGLRDEVSLDVVAERLVDVARGTVAPSTAGVAFVRTVP